MTNNPTNAQLLWNKSRSFDWRQSKWALTVVVVAIFVGFFLEGCCWGTCLWYDLLRFASSFGWLKMHPMILKAIFSVSLFKGTVSSAADAVRCWASYHTCPLQLLHEKKGGAWDLDVLPSFAGRHTLASRLCTTMMGQRPDRRAHLQLEQSHNLTGRHVPFSPFFSCFDIFLFAI